ncbi:hypothetical protein [Mangrovibrevibacter kandeliae]|uniref:hypothetical protein n=1 Tax=Mangrovibrevibacter kandeliae TaxID=2968473 RepID=UPI0021181891|nr:MULTISPECIES: hypothetical protein [unclassified Aurantimonas]MCQ8781402.1 hypothetical protein [Aurantimonas sp. CSK15Z-1]MCW4114183.1 hypothetical protein [Aurantimonas sp. MSK8Z-1]
MSDKTSGSGRAAGVFPQQSDRHEKGSAMGLIKADAEATQAKTARLKALRIARDAAAPAAEPKPKARRPRASKARQSA